MNNNVTKFYDYPTPGSPRADPCAGDIPLDTEAAWQAAVASVVADLARDGRKAAAENE